MERQMKMDFCIECRKNTEYELKKEPIKQVIRDKEYEFYVTTAYCKECGKEMNISGLIDRNVKEVDEQYRAAENIVTVEDIKKLMSIYNIGKAPLSLALGFGEVTISRYLAGQIPSKEYSNIIRKALSSSAFMKSMLIENRNRIGETAYNKAISKVNQLDKMFSSVSPKLLAVISYVFKKMKEVTPLMLQKILYYIQSIYMAIWDTPIFPEDCEAWIHGPVYRNVYILFKDFKYDPIDDDRFSLLEELPQELTNNEKKVINLVISTFGMYSGKTLESITHREIPWREARRDYLDEEPSHEKISKATMKSYFNEVRRNYDITTEVGLRKYILDMLQTSQAC